MKKIMFCDNMVIHIGNSKKWIHGILKLIRDEKKLCMEDYYSKTKSLATYTKHYLEDVI